GFLLAAYDNRYSCPGVDRGDVIQESNVLQCDKPGISLTSLQGLVPSGERRDRSCRSSRRSPGNRRCATEALPGFHARPDKAAVRYPEPGIPRGCHQAYKRMSIS